MQSIWITGASSGIGAACAYKYAGEGARLVLTSSSAERLESVALKCRERGASEVIVLPYDLTDLDDVENLRQFVQMELSNDMTNRCNTVIILGCQTCHTIFFSIRTHTTEFHNLKFSATFCTANLFIQYRSAIIRFYQNSCN